MGIGDEIMVTGQVKRMVEDSGHPGFRVAVRDPRKEIWHRWHYMWSGNPHIAQPGEHFDAVLDNCPGQRPYIAGKTTRAWVWNEGPPTPGQIFLSNDELRFAELARDRIIIQPFVKASASPNKRWPLESWQALVASRPRWPWLQVGEGCEPRIGGVEFLRTPNFRDACAALLKAKAIVVQEGALHHAAAALGLRAVVIFGGFISPKVTGYDMHTNLFVESEQHPLGCGSRTPCFHCHRAMLSIRPHHILDSLKEI